MSGRVLTSYCVPEYSVFNDGSITARRCVSSSLWLQYDGGTLNDNGRIVGADVSSRTTPWNKGQSFCDMQSISALKSAYDGQMPKGAYGIWRPQCALDTQFRGFNEPWLWNMPYTVIVGFNPSSDGQQMRLRCVTNWEFQTHNNLYQRMASTVDPSQISFAYQALATFPCVMENSFHWSDIAKFIRGAAKTILPHAGKIGTFLGAAGGGPEGAMLGGRIGGMVEGLGDFL